MVKYKEFIREKLQKLNNLPKKWQQVIIRTVCSAEMRKRFKGPELFPFLRKAFQNILKLSYIKLQFIITRLVD